MYFDSFLRTKVTIPFLFILLFVSLAVFFISAEPVRGQGGTLSDQSWEVRSYIWNRRLNLWGRTDCAMSIGGIGSHIGGETGECDGSSPKLNYVQYYHDIDPDDPENGIFYSQLRGNAWSPLYGVINFSESDFPSDSCYGLTGSTRQARVERVTVGEQSVVRLVGCAYVPFLRDFILLNASGAIASDMPSGWSGVGVTAVEESGGSYIKLNGCAWSSKNNFWAFGPNERDLTGIGNCLPGDDRTGHNAGLRNALDNELALFGRLSGSTPSINLTNSNARIGQEIGYKYECPEGYAKPEIAFKYGDSGKFEAVEVVLKFFSGWYRSVFSKPILEASITCSDRSGIFIEERMNDISGVFVEDSLVISSFSASPAVVLGGGVVTFEGLVSNQGSFLDKTLTRRVREGEGGAADVEHDEVVLGNYARCVIVNKLTGDVVRGFDVDGLNVSIDAFDVAVQDTVYELSCQYKVERGGAHVWSDPLVRNVAVKVLPSSVVERNVSESVAVPEFSLVGSDVQISVPAGVSTVYVYKLNRGAQKTIGDESSAFETFSSGQYGSINVSRLTDGDFLVAEARGESGSWSQRVVYTNLVHGVCGLQRNSCLSGSVSAGVVGDTATNHHWRCDGMHGGFDSSTCQGDLTTPGGGDDVSNTPPPEDGNAGQAPEDSNAGQAPEDDDTDSGEADEPDSCYQVFGAVSSGSIIKDTYTLSADCFRTFSTLSFSQHYKFTLSAGVPSVTVTADGGASATAVAVYKEGDSENPLGILISNPYYVPYTQPYGRVAIPNLDAGIYVINVSSNSQSVLMSLEIAE